MNEQCTLPDDTVQYTDIDEYHRVDIWFILEG
jgi:hypothetical protein